MTLHTLVHSCDSSHAIVILFIPLCQLWSKSFLIFLFLLLRVYINYSDVQSMYFTYYMYSNVTTSTRINIFKCTYVHLCLFPFETNGTNAFQSTLVCWPIMQQYLQRYSPQWTGQALPPVNWSSTPPLWTGQVPLSPLPVDRQTPVNLLPCSKLRLRAVKRKKYNLLRKIHIEKNAFSLLTFRNCHRHQYQYAGKSNWKYFLRKHVIDINLYIVTLVASEYRAGGRRFRSRHPTSAETRVCPPSANKAEFIHSKKPVTILCRQTFRPCEIIEDWYLKT